MKPKEFWLCGDPNEYDVGIWYDHHPGFDVVYGKEFHQHHVIEYSAYEKLKKFVEKIAETQGGSWIECYAPDEAQDLLNEHCSS